MLQICTSYDCPINSYILSCDYGAPVEIKTSQCLNISENGCQSRHQSDCMFIGDFKPFILDYVEDCEVSTVSK